MAPGDFSKGGAAIIRPTSTAEFPARAAPAKSWLSFSDPWLSLSVIPAAALSLVPLALEAIGAPAWPDALCFPKDAGACARVCGHVCDSHTLEDSYVCLSRYEYVCAFACLRLRLRGCVCAYGYIGVFVCVWLCVRVCL